MKPLVVRPSRGRSCFLALSITSFTLVGLSLVIWGDSSDRFIGALSIAFFGGGGLIMVMRLGAQRATLRVEEGGLRPCSGGYIPWEHVGAIGATVAGGTPALGVRVTNIPAYLDTFTPQQRLRGTGLARMTRRVAPRIAGSDKATTRVDLYDHDPRVIATADPEELDAWAWSRSVNGGYDVIMAGVLLNKSPEALAAELVEYRNEALSRRQQP